MKNILVSSFLMIIPSVIIPLQYSTVKIANPQTDNAIPNPDKFIPSEKPKIDVDIEGTDPASAILRWKNVGNTGFGNINDGYHLNTVSRFRGGNRAEVLIYYANDGNWWHLWLEGNDIRNYLMKWKLDGRISQIGAAGYTDTYFESEQGDFLGNGRSNILLYQYGRNIIWRISHEGDDTQPTYPIEILELIQQGQSPSL